ncbi:MAG TPA: serine hydrolase domain-containing protein [Caulobacteraceae bacterium]|nr:serine hydrolase domain-containing protein [Caulobacteraceae bacterium]
MTSRRASRPAPPPVAAILALALWASSAVAQAPAPPEPVSIPAPAPLPTPIPAPAPAAAAARPNLPARPAPSRPAVPAPAAAASAAPSRPGARLAPGQAIPLADLEAFVDGAVREAMAAGHVAGAAVAVVQNGQIVLEKGYGVARTRPQVPVDPRTTLFRLGSISKTFTWIGVLKAAEAGRMNLDQPVNAYLPPNLRVSDEGFADPVRVRQLMDHSGGFEDRELGRLFVDAPRRLSPLDQALLRQRPHRVRKPGELSTYSNYGAALAGAAAAQVAGQPFESMIEAGVLGPMGLADTTFRQPYPETEGLPAPMPEAMAARLSESYLWTPQGRRILPVELAGLTPAVAASSTAQDMARYMTVLLAGGATPAGPAYGPQTAQRLRTPLSRPAPGLNGWAGGFMEYSLPGGFQGFGHDGATVGFRSSLVIVPELGLGLFVVGNTDTADGLTRRLPGAVVQRFYAGYRLPPAPDAAVMREAAKAYGGAYLPTRRAYQGLEGLVDRLTRTIRVSVGDDGRLVIAQGRAARLFAPDGPAGSFRALYGEDRTVFVPAKGRAKAFFLPSGLGAAERVSLLHRPGTLAATALASLAASLLVLAGLLIRGPREGRESRAQTGAARLEAVAACVWLAAGAAFGTWTLGASDAATLMYRWPSATLMTSSTLALAAAVLTLVLAVQLRAVWVGERRVVGWSSWRKLRHTATVLVYLALVVVLGAWGALTPWAN